MPNSIWTVTTTLLTKSNYTFYQIYKHIIVNPYKKGEFIEQF